MKNTKNISAFLEQVHADSALQKKLLAIDPASPSAKDAWIELSREAGTPFSDDDLIDFVRQNEELCEDELDCVVGGQTVQKPKVSPTIGDLKQPLAIFSRISKPPS